MNICVVDRIADRRTEIVRVLSLLEHTVFAHTTASWVDQNCPREVGACFFHSGDSGLWDRFSAIPGIELRLFWYSEKGVNGVPNPPGKGKGIPRGITATLVPDQGLFEELLSDTGEPDREERRAPAESPAKDEPTTATPGTAETRVSPPSVGPADASEPAGGRQGGAGQARLLQGNRPMLVALSILCEGYLIATGEEGKKPKNLPPGAGLKVERREWWSQPFTLVKGTLERQVGEEWGPGEVDDHVLALVSWILKETEELGVPLSDLIPRVREALYKNLL